MSDSLSSFIASGIEFIVGGLMLLSASAFVILAVGWELPEFLDIDLSTQDASLVVLGVALAAAYAAGVVGEGLSRLLLEWDLERITVRDPDFLPDSEREEERAKTAEAARQAALEAGEEPPPPFKSTPSTRRNQWIAWRLGDGFTATDLKTAKDEREVQRAAVASHPALLADVESQLKRLRIERISLLCAILVVVGFAAAGEWLEASVTLVVGAVLLYLVHERFNRYCGSIARAHDHVERIERGLVSL